MGFKDRWLFRKGKMDSPCLKCPMSGCGSYHDACPDFKRYKDDRQRLIDDNLERLYGKKGGNGSAKN